MSNLDESFHYFCIMFSSTRYSPQCRPPCPTCPSCPEASTCPTCPSCETCATCAVCDPPVDTSLPVCGQPDGPYNYGPIASDDTVCKEDYFRTLRCEEQPYFRDWYARIQLFNEPRRSEELTLYFNEVEAWSRTQATCQDKYRICRIPQ